MRIAVISDTHDKLPASVLESIGDADQIWHLGDVCSPSIALSLEALGLPLTIVRGNCDYTIDWPMTCTRTLGGKKFHLIHIPPAEAPVGVDYLLHGHTHVPRDEMIKGVRFLNPGTTGKPNKGAPPSYAWLSVSDDGHVIWKTVPI